MCIYILYVYTICLYIYTYIYIYIYLSLEKTAGKWQKCNLVSGMASVASDMGWL